MKRVIIYIRIKTYFITLLLLYYYHLNCIKLIMSLDNFEVIKRLGKYFKPLSISQVRYTYAVMHKYNNLICKS